MSKLHVTQIEGYISKELTSLIDMKDYDHHSDPVQAKNAFLTRGLAALAVSHITDVPIQELSTSITDGQDDGGIDLIYFNNNELTLYLVQTKWHGDGHGSIDLGDTLKFIDGVKKILDNDLESLNKKIRSKKSDIERAIFDANAKFALVLAHTGQEELNADIVSVLNKYIDAQNDTSEIMFLQTLNQKNLHKAVAAGLAGTPISVEVQMNGWGQLREPQFAVYGKVCASDVASWMRTNGNRLFDRNLRHFLGTNPINQDIVETLLNRPEDFWYFNNGITAIATNIAKKPVGGNSTDSGIFECTGFCVVNGAQTVGSISAAQIRDPASVERAFVPVRIISSGNSHPSFSNEVTRFTNTQNSIEKRDFVALDPEQERIRQELHIEGVEYFYKSGSATGAGSKKFDLIEATIAMACVQSEVTLAVQAKREISKLWEDLSKAPYKQLFNGSTTGPFVWQAVQALRAIDKALNLNPKKYTGRDALVCIHANRFIEWASFQRLGVKQLNFLSLTDSDVEKAVSDITEKLVSIVRSDFSDSYPASLFKNIGKCRDIASDF